MNSVLDIEKQVLSLPKLQREQVAVAAWDSLVDDPTASCDPDIDPEGIQMASERDAEIESGLVKTISHEEFLRRTGGNE